MSKLERKPFHGPSLTERVYTQVKASDMSCFGPGLSSEAAYPVSLKWSLGAEGKPLKYPEE